MYCRSTPVGHPAFPTHRSGPLHSLDIQTTLEIRQCNASRPTFPRPLAPEISPALSVKVYYMYIHTYQRGAESKPLTKNYFKAFLLIYDYNQILSLETIFSSLHMKIFCIYYYYLKVWSIYSYVIEDKLSRMPE